MFSGIVEEIGSVSAVQSTGNGRAISLRARQVLEDLRPGDSIAIDGVCQTVVGLFDAGFTVESVATTLERTTLAEFAVGRRVNLERALALGARLGGHLVQGHVDGVGRVRRLERRAELVAIDVSMPELVAAVTILHGSIALNGVSLTVNQLPAPDVVQVSIVPYTWNHTALADLVPGDGVNLEGDLIGKYVRKLLGGAASAAHGEAESAPEHLRHRWGY